jgi:hypothetical protein
VASADLNGDGAVDDDDAFLLLGPTVFGTYDDEVLRGSGDVNADRSLNALDIQLFVDIALVPDGDYPLRSLYAADMTRNGVVDHEDVPLFVEQILNGSAGAQGPPDTTSLIVRIITPP